MAKKPAPKKPAAKKPAAKKPAAKKPAAKPATTALTPGFRALIEIFLERPGVTQGQMMGCPGLRVANKFFAMEWDGRLLVKLPKPVVDGHVAAGRGANFDPGMGRPMKEWLTVQPRAADWRALAEQSFDFVSASL